jgi:chromosome partitioning protein
VKGGDLVIVVFLGKSGKTTNAVNVAAALTELLVPVSRQSPRQRRVRLLDADWQGSVLEWDAQRTRPRLFEVRECAEPTIYRDLPELLDGVDDLVIDCPAGTGRPGRAPDERTKIIRNAILAALSEPNGVVVGVVVPSGWELWAADDVMDVLTEAWTHESAGPTARNRTVLLLNRAKTTRRGGEGRPDRVPRMVRAATERLAQAPLPLLDTVIHDRAEFVEAPIHGLSVTEFAPHSPAAAEARALATELLTLAGEAK